jgi:hypothetical protein
LVTTLVDLRHRGLRFTRVTILGTKEILETKEIPETQETQEILGIRET